MLNCTKNWQPIWHNKINYNISGGLLYVSSGLVFSAAPAQNICLQKPTAGFFPNSSHKKSAISGMATRAKTMVLRVHIQRPKLFSEVQEKQFSCPTRKGQSGPGSNQHHCEKPGPCKTKHKEKKEQASATQAVQNSKAGQTRQRKDSSESTECLSKRRHPTKLGAKPKNRPELRSVSAKGNCSGSAIADIYISH